MRRARLIGDGTSYYHVMSRVIERKFYLGITEKEKFRSMMWRVAEFSGINILTYAIMDNHFHLLIEVPEREVVDDDELFRRLELIYNREQVYEIWCEFKGYLNEGLLKAADSVRQRFLYRMYDMSEFMKTLKLRFSKWYNRREERRGTLWEERFKSVLVEGPVGEYEAAGFGNEAILTMAAYIDLNAVRAGLVEDPKDYRWCGYGEAMAGGKTARCGLSLLLGVGCGNVSEWKDTGRRYRMLVYEDGGGRGFSRERVKEVLDAGGMLSQRELLCCRVRYFSDGMVIGRKEFVNDLFEKRRHLFGSKRKTGARKMRGGDWDGLCSMRDLRCEPIL